MFWDSILLALTLYIGIQIGKAIKIVELRQSLKKIAAENNIDLNTIILSETAENPNLLLLEAERVDDIILIYDRINNEFICQANSMEEAAQKFHERKNNMLGALVVNDKNLYFVKGKVKNDIIEVINES
jgi:hypothetical protein